MVESTKIFVQFDQILAKKIIFGYFKPILWWNQLTNQPINHLTEFWSDKPNIFANVEFPAEIFQNMYYERKNIIFNEQNLKLTKNNTFKNVFMVEFLFTIAFY